MTNTNTIRVLNNSAENRYETKVEGQLALAEYQLKDNVVIFTHTEVPSELEGQGIGSKIARFALDDVRAKGQQVIPLCPFIKGYIERHEAYQPLVLERKAWRELLKGTGLF